MYKEINFCGIFLPPFFLCLLLTGCVHVILHRYCDRIKLQQYVWNRPVFELAVFVIVLALVVVIL